MSRECPTQSKVKGKGKKDDKVYDPKKMKCLKCGKLGHKAAVCRKADDEKEIGMIPLLN